MKNFIDAIIPKSIDNEYKGPVITAWIFMAIALVSTGRSLVHFLAADGGAGSIAGLDLSQGSENIIFAFGLWGVSQLLYAFIQLLVAFRYRQLIPLFYLILLIEILGRMLVGIIKSPVLEAGTPPGGIANYVLLPLVVFMFFLSIRTVKTKLN